MSDSLCVCGHHAEHHADPASGDTRCLAVEDRRDLLYVFDDGRDGRDGRDGPIGHCACLAYQPTRPGHNDGQAS